MKRAISTAFILLISAMTLSSCFSYTPPSHNYAREWSSDAEYHWHACTDEGCDSKFSYSSHSFDSGTADVEGGTKVYTCIFCDYQKSEQYTAKTEITASEWSDAIAEDKFNNLFYEYVRTYNMQQQRIEIKYAGDMLLIVSEENGAVREAYMPNTDSYAYSSAEVAGCVRDLLLGNYPMFRYDEEGKCYNGTVRDGDGQAKSVSCQFADGNLLYLRVTGIGNDADKTVHEYRFSRYGSVTVDVPIDFLNAQLDAAVSVESLSNVTIKGSFKGESITLLIEDEHTSTYSKMEEIASELAAFELTDISGYVILDGVIDSIVDGSDERMTSIEFKNGRLIRFESGNTDLVFSNYGTTDDGEIYEGGGGENETPIRPV